MIWLVENFHILEVADAMFQQVSGFSSRYTEVWESWNCSFLCLLRREQLEGKPLKTIQLLCSKLFLLILRSC